MTENDLRDKVSKWLKKQPDLWFLKVAGNRFQRPGVPDFLLCVRGAFGAIELKAPNGRGKVTELQKLELNHIQIAGGNSYICKDLPCVVAAVEDIRNTTLVTKK